MNDKKKKFVNPEVEVVDFSEEDIITASVPTDLFDDGGTDNGEPW